MDITRFSSLNYAKQIILKNYQYSKTETGLKAEIIGRIAAAALITPAAAVDIVFHSVAFLPSLAFALGKSIVQLKPDFSLPKAHLTRIYNAIVPLLMGSFVGFLDPLSGLSLIKTLHPDLIIKTSNHTNTVAKNAVIVGGGPVGITLASILKLLNPEAKITVLDGRSLADRKRNFGLSIGGDSVDALMQILSQVDRSKLDADGLIKFKTLETTLQKWSNQNVRTKEIEQQMTEHASNLGVNVLCGAEYKVTGDDLKLEGQLNEKQTLIKEASVVIGCDGARSVIREELKINKLAEEALKYMIELKFDTPAATQPRTSKEAVFMSSKTGHVDTEILSRRVEGDVKPGTYLCFVPQELYNSIRIDQNGVTKGTSGNGWSLEELRQLAEKDPRAEIILDQVLRYFKGKEYSNEKIGTIELAIYRSEESVKNHLGKQFMLVGDSNSGLVLQRGFNKGLVETAMAVKAITEFFGREPDSLEADEIPSEFLDYQKQTKNLYVEEQIEIHRRNRVISLAESAAATAYSSTQLAGKVSKGK